MALEYAPVRSYAARLVRVVDDRMVRIDFSTDADLRQAMEDLGYHCTGLETNPRLRFELIGHPKFSDLCGPMWDGDAIRYEDAETNRRMSA